MRNLCIFLIIVFLFSISSIAFAEKPKHTLGLDLPSYGWIQYNDNDEIIGVKGINLGLGYSQKDYHEPVNYDQWNTYTGFGTMVLYNPYLTFGTDYISRANENGDYWKIGVDIGGGVLLGSKSEFIPIFGLSVSYGF